MGRIIKTLKKLQEKAGIQVIESLILIAIFGTIAVTTTTDISETISDETTEVITEMSNFVQ